jgi:exopolyphosphatase/guanosine-5'-triphosphate,3'-diphosphate pyrophosphatase
VSRIAAIDVGSNAIRFYVVEPTDTSSYRVLENLREPIRLGGDVFLTGTIREENIQGAESAFRRFAQLLRNHSVKTVRAVATSATREAGNGEIVLDRLEHASGIRVEVITGDEEAYLITLAVGKKIPLKKQNALIVDLGGGSVEIAFVENGKITSTESHNFGAVRLLDVLSSAGEDLVKDGSFLKEYMGLVSRKLSRRLDGKKAPLLIATGGNIEAVAQIPAVQTSPHSDFPDTVVIRPSNLRRVMEEIAGMTVKARMESFGLREDRADVILPACYVYHKIAEINGSEEILVPRVSLKDGIVLDLLRQEKDGDRSRDLREQILVSCRLLAARYRVDLPHAEKVASLAGRIFDQTESIHQLGGKSRILLEAAALLHDIGYYISMQKHHKHSYYIIANSEIVGLSPAERLLVAHIARYHRKSAPRADHAEFEGLPKRDRAAVRGLAGILRIADALDKEHADAIEEISCKLGDSQLVIHAKGKTSGRLEGWGMKKNAELFRETFGVDVRLKVDANG